MFLVSDEEHGVDASRRYIALHKRLRTSEALVLGQ